MKKDLYKNITVVAMVVIIVTLILYKKKDVFMSLDLGFVSLFGDGDVVAESCDSCDYCDNCDLCDACDCDNTPCDS